MWNFVVAAAAAHAAAAVAAAVAGVTVSVFHKISCLHSNQVFFDLSTEFEPRNLKLEKGSWIKIINK